MMDDQNRLQAAAKHDDAEIKKGYQTVIETVKGFYTKPVLVTVLVSLEDGDLFDFAEIGDHTADGIQWIGNALDFHRRFEHCMKARKQETANDDGEPVERPEGITPEQWEQIPAPMQRVVSRAAKEGALVISHGDGLPNSLAPSGGSAEPLADAPAETKKGLDE